MKFKKRLIFYDVLMLSDLVSVTLDVNSRNMYVDVNIILHFTFEICKQYKLAFKGTPLRLFDLMGLEIYLFIYLFIFRLMFLFM
jgi:hypothetical protein